MKVNRKRSLVDSDEKIIRILLSVFILIITKMFVNAGVTDMSKESRDSLEGNWKATYVTSINL